MILIENNFHYIEHWQYYQLYSLFWELDISLWPQERLITLHWLGLPGVIILTDIEPEKVEKNRHRPVSSLRSVPPSYPGRIPSFTNRRHHRQSGVGAQLLHFICKIKVTVIVSLYLSPPTTISMYVL